MGPNTMNPIEDGCMLWTPWGPQAASDAKPQLSSLRETLRKLASPKPRRPARDTTKPECAYEP